MLLIVVLVLIAILALYLLGVFNNLVRSRNLVKNAFSQIDVQLKRRYDLIPNLVETAKGYMKHEKETLENVIRARNQAFQSYENLGHNPTKVNEMQGLMQAEGQLGQAMSRLMMVMESYPDLKANSTMNSLTEELTSTENKISFARQAYNDSVMTYNNSREVFPNSVVAGMFNFSEASAYRIENVTERENVKVAF